MHLSFRQGFEKTANESWAHPAAPQYSGGKNITGLGIFRPIKSVKQLIKNPVAGAKQAVVGNINLAKKTGQGLWSGKINKAMTGLSMVGAASSAVDAAKPRMGMQGLSFT